MTTSLAPLRDEHRELLPHIDQLRTTADRVGTMPRARLVADVRTSLDFLTRHLRPHALVEDDVLYPEVARLMGSPVAVETMRRDHEAIARLTDELDNVLGTIHDRAEITRTTQNDMRRLLYGLYALISVHFAKEEDVYVPLVESHLDDSEAAYLLSEMRSAHERHEGNGHDTTATNTDTADTDTARDVLEAFNAEAVVDTPGAPAQPSRLADDSPASHANAPVPPG
jgi:iron-sulfur cluster repair protein YtfE (RIC family)